MAEHRDNLVSLPTAVKDYGPLRVMVWASAGGKHAFHHDTKRGQLIEGIGELIRTRPDDRWLVVAHRHTRRQKSTAEMLRKHLPGVSVSDDPPRADDNGSPSPTVQVITWGRHMASNAFADIPNVILAGTLFMRDSQNTALTHLAQGRSVREGFRPKDEVAAIVRGEHAHNILQALCRGRVRQLDGERCRDMNAYIIASERSGIADLIPNIFPGCKVGVWRRDTRLTGKMGEAVAWLEKEALTGNCKVSYRSIQEAINVTSKNFAKLVTGHDAWNAALAGIGWQPDREQRARNLIRTSRT